MFLIRKTGAKVKAHLWNGEDTLCRMYSTGGMKRNRFWVAPNAGLHEICHMCSCVQLRDAGLPSGSIDLAGGETRGVDTSDLRDNAN